MRNIRSLVLGLVLVSLAGCSAVSNYAEDLKYTSSLRYFVSDESKQERYHNICKNIGISPDSANWEQCMIQAFQADERKAASRAASQREANERARNCGMYGQCL